MVSPHLFLMWFVLRERQPSLIVESGVWKGQGTWFIERACPKADILCIDPNLSRLVYKSDRATYSTKDFAKHGRLDGAFAFFDDHQNACHRVREAKAAGVQEMLFEDNYAENSQADCLTLKMARAGKAFFPQRTWRNALKQAVGILAPANDPFPSDLIEVYEELPPVIAAPTTRWGTPWLAEPVPLLTEAPAPFPEEAQGYTWMAYIRLNPE